MSFLTEYFEKKEEKEEIEAQKSNFYPFKGILVI